MAADVKTVKTIFFYAVGSLLDFLWPKKSVHNTRNNVEELDLCIFNCAGIPALEPGSNDR